MTTKTTRSGLDDLLQRQQERDQAAKEAYDALVIQYADGVAADEDEAEQILFGSERDVQTLRSDVEALLRRRLLRQQYDTKPTSEAELRRIASDKAKEEAAFAELERNHRRRLGILAGERDEQLALVAMAKGAAAELRQGASSELHEKHDALTRQLQGIGKQRDAIRETLHRAEQLAATDRHRANSAPEPTSSEYRLQAANYDLRAGRCRAEIADLDEQARGIEAELEKVNEAMLTVD